MHYCAHNNFFSVSWGSEALISVTDHWESIVAEFIEVEEIISLHSDLNHYGYENIAG